MEVPNDDKKVAKGEDEVVESFWSNTSYKVSLQSPAQSHSSLAVRPGWRLAYNLPAAAQVINRGNTATALVDLIVPSDK